MKYNNYNAQINNLKTVEMYKRQLMTLAENVFDFDKLPEYIDTAYLNKQLLRKGSIAFFMDEVLGLLALPYIVIGSLDVYGRPRRIQVIGRNGYSKILNEKEFVIMYDNNGRYPLWLDILQVSERMALIQRTIDINVAQQKTPRFWKTKTEKEQSIKDLVNSVDSCENQIVTYDDLDIDDTTIVMAPAPFVSNDLELLKDKTYNEFLRLIGIANISFQKRERQISDEIQAMQGGTIASRYSRFEPRQKACREIKKKFNIDIDVKYYDGLPTTKNELDNIFTSDLLGNDSIIDIVNDNDIKKESDII